MVRAAAKNHTFVTVVTDASQYAPLLEELDANDNTVGDETRRALAVAAFASTAAFDAQIVAWLQRDHAAARSTSTWRSSAPARPCATARTRTSTGARYRIDRVPRAGGTASSSTPASRCRTSTSTTPTPPGASCTTCTSRHRRRPTVAIIKHANPCGVASADDLATAYQRALECDERSAFGGIVALNRPVDTATAARMVAGPQADLVLAPGWEPGTIDALVGKRKNTPPPHRGPAGAADPRLPPDQRRVPGAGRRTTSRPLASDWRVVTKRAPTDAEWRDAELAWRICGHVKSNAIVLVKDGQAVGIGAGQQNRVESGEIAAKKAAGRAAGGGVARRMRSTRSPTASRRPPPPASR